MNRLDTALLFIDQIPVWLKVEAGQQLVSEAKLTALKAGQKMRRARRKAAAKQLARLVTGLKPGDEDEEQPPEASGDKGASYLTKGPGDVNACRWRVTLLARQAVLDYWNPKKIPSGGQMKYY